MTRKVNPLYLGKAPEDASADVVSGVFGTQTAYQNTTNNFLPVNPPTSTAVDRIYIPSSFDDGNNVWENFLGTSGTDSSSYRGNPTLATNVTPANGSSKITSYVQGGTGDGLVFSGTQVANNYTTIHVSRWAGGSNQRIWGGTSGNWLSGHWNGASAVAYHNGWLISNNGAGSNWLISVDAPSYYRGYWGTGSEQGGTGGSTTMGGSWALNATANTEYSNWQCYGMWYWGSVLSANDRTIAVDFIKNLTGVG